MKRTVCDYCEKVIRHSEMDLLFTEKPFRIRLRPVKVKSGKAGPRNSDICSKCARLALAAMNNQAKRRAK